MDARLAELAARVDAFFARVHGAQANEMRCEDGCAACCAAELTVTGVEAAAISAHVSGLPAAERAALAARAQGPVDPARPRCAALDDADRCGIYAARPLVCRSHGLPIRSRDGRGLPVVDACSLNFTTQGPAAVPAADVLDQTTLSTVLLAVDAAHAAATGRVAGERTPLRALLV